MMATGLDLELEEPVRLFPRRVSRRLAKESYWNQISDFFQNSKVPEYDDSLLIEAVEDCAEWKRYTEQDVDDIEILYERNNGKGKVLSTLSSDDEDDFIHKELEKFKIEGKLWVLSGLYQAPYTDKKKKFEFALPQGKGLRVLNAVRDFKIPWNIYCPTIDGERNIVKWKHGLKRNQWLLENPFIAKRPVTEVCSCMGSRCGSLCLNRSVQIECTPYNCKFGDQDCGNRAFADLMNAYRDHSKYAFGCEVVQTERKGCGLLSIRSFNTGSLVVEYTGEVINLDEVEHRLNTIYKDSDSYYFLGLEEEYVIDAGQKGSVARFANHSCDPNAEMQKWYVDGEARIGLFAKRPIEAGEEITYDYNFEWFENGEPQKCYCDSKNCNGFIGKNPDANEDDSDDDVNGKRGIKVSHPSKATTIYSSESSSDSDLEDFDQVGLVEALENFNHDYDASAAVKAHLKAEPVNDKNAKGKYSPGAKLKEVMVDDDVQNGNKKKASSDTTASSKVASSTEKIETKSTTLKQPEPKVSNVRGTEPKVPADPRKNPAKRAEAKKADSKANAKADTKLSEAKTAKDSKSPTESQTKNPPGRPLPQASPEYPEKPIKRTSRRSQSIAFDDLEMNLTPHLKRSLAINMAPPGGKTDIKDQCIVDVISSKPKPTINNTKSSKSPPKKTTTPASSTGTNKGTTSAKRAAPSSTTTSKREPPVKRRKLIIDSDSESEDEPIPKHGDSKAQEESSVGILKSEEQSDSKALEKAKPSPSLPAKPAPKKESVFAKKNNPVSRKAGTVEKSSSPVTTAATAAYTDTTFFNLKKAKRNQNRPVQTTESYQSSPPVSSSSNSAPSYSTQPPQPQPPVPQSQSNTSYENSNPPDESNELVVHESSQNYPQPVPHHYNYQYDNWNGYYDENSYYGYYYGDQYYQQPPQSQTYPPQPQPQPYPDQAQGAQPNGEVPSPRPNAYPEGYYQSPQPPPQPQPYPPQGYQYYHPPPPPVPPQRGYGYAPPPPPPHARGYPGWQGYPPPPQPYPVQPGGGAYPYGNAAAAAYPPGAFTVDAENEMLVESPQEDFADEVLEQPADSEADKKKEIVATSRGVPADPRRRKK